MDDSSLSSVQQDRPVSTSLRILTTTADSRRGPGRVAGVSDGDGRAPENAPDPLVSNLNASKSRGDESLLPRRFTQRILTRPPQIHGASLDMWSLPDGRAPECLRFLVSKLNASNIHDDES
jgi:hypothetical protein